MAQSVDVSLWRKLMPQSVDVSLWRKLMAQTVDVSLWHRLRARVSVKVVVDVSFVSPIALSQ